MIKSKFEIGNMVKVITSAADKFGAKRHSPGTIGFVKEIEMDFNSMRVSILVTTGEYDIPFWYNENELELYVDPAKTYEQGLEDDKNEAWEIMGILTHELSYEERIRMFHVSAIKDIMYTFTYEEIKEKIEEFKAGMTLNVGDEVTGPGGRGFITDISDHNCRVLWYNGQCGRVDRKLLEKTGRTVGQILKGFSDERM